MNTYAHVLPATQRLAVEEIDRLLGNGLAREKTSDESAADDQNGSSLQTSSSAS